jgi:hypothetical protein
VRLLLGGETHRPSFQVHTITKATQGLSVGAHFFSAGRGLASHTLNVPSSHAVTSCIPSGLKARLLTFLYGR